MGGGGPKGGGGGGGADEGRGGGSGGVRESGKVVVGVSMEARPGDPGPGTTRPHGGGCSANPGGFGPGGKVAGPVGRSGGGSQGARCPANSEGLGTSGLGTSTGPAPPARCVGASPSEASPTPDAGAEPPPPRHPRHPTAAREAHPQGHRRHLTAAPEPRPPRRPPYRDAAPGSRPRCRPERRPVPPPSPPPRRTGRPVSRAWPWGPCPRWCRRTAAPTSRPRDRWAFPLLAHAPNCPPRERYENGASGKSGAAPPLERRAECVPNSPASASGPPGTGRGNGPGERP